MSGRRITILGGCDGDAPGFAPFSAQAFAKENGPGEYDCTLAVVRDPSAEKPGAHQRKQEREHVRSARYFLGHGNYEMALRDIAWALRARTAAEVQESVAECYQPSGAKKRAAKGRKR